MWLLICIKYHLHWLLLLRVIFVTSLGSCLLGNWRIYAGIALNYYIVLGVLASSDVVHFEHWNARQVLKVLLGYYLFTNTLLLCVLHYTITYIQKTIKL